MTSRTERLRALMARLQTLQAEHNRQLEEMRSLDEAIETEMDTLDKGDE